MDVLLLGFDSWHVRQDVLAGQKIVEASFKMVFDFLLLRKAKTIRFWFMKHWICFFFFSLSLFLMDLFRFESRQVRKYGWSDDSQKRYDSLSIEGNTTLFCLSPCFSFKHLHFYGSVSVLLCLIPRIPLFWLIIELIIPCIEILFLLANFSCTFFEEWWSPSFFSLCLSLLVDIQMQFFLLTVSWEELKSKKQRKNVFFCLTKKN